MRSFFRLMNRFRWDRRGNVAVIFGIAAVPLIAAVGIAIDYSEAMRIKAKLQSAADAAAVAAISQNSAGWLAASTMTSNGPVTVAQTDASNIFTGNVSAWMPSLFTLNASGTTATVTKTGPTLTSTVTFSANVPVTFMGVLGVINGGTPVKNIVVGGSSSASSSLPLYLDFYVMLDVSGSMGLPSTNAEQTRLASVNPDNFNVYPNGCTFACHFQALGSCNNPIIGETTNAGVLPAYSAYPTSNAGPSTPTVTKPGYCLGYLISRVSQSAYQALLNSAVTPTTKTQFPMKTGQVI